MRGRGAIPHNKYRSATLVGLRHPELALQAAFRTVRSLTHAMVCSNWGRILGRGETQNDTTDHIHVSQRDYQSRHNRTSWSLSVTSSYIGLL